MLRRGKHAAFAEDRLSEINENRAGRHGTEPSNLMIANFRSFFHATRAKSVATR